MHDLSASLRTAFASLIISCGLSTQSFAAGENWVTDFEAAKAQAAKENKDLLIDFTGSDWCGWCKRLVAEVFSHDAFKEGVAESFVLVELDYPSKKVTQPPELKAQNAELKDTYGIQGYPTIYVTDAAGRPYARTGYQAGGPEAYVAHLNAFRKQREKRDSHFKKAEAAKGLEKAGHLIAGLKLMPEESLMSFYGEEMAVIKKLDPDDSLKFVHGQESQALFAELEGKVQSTFRSGKTEEAQVWIKDFIGERKPEGELLQSVLMLDAICFAVAEKMDEALSALDKVLEVSDSGEQAERALGMKIQILDQQRFMLLSKELEAKSYTSVIEQIDLALKSDLDKYPMERLLVLKAQALHGDGKVDEAIAVLDAINEPYRPTQAQIRELKSEWEKVE
jgi:thioredoxin-related protein